MAEHLTEQQCLKMWLNRKEVRDDFRQLKTNVSSVIGRKNDG